MEMFERVRAINRVYPDAKYDIADDNSITWFDDRTMPTDDELAQTITDLENEDRYINLKITTTAYIYENYPQNKQNSDLTDKFYFESQLREAGVADLDKQVNDQVAAYYSGTAMDDIIAGLTDDMKIPLGQLIKVAIRVKWVQMCKSAYMDAKLNNTVLTLPDVNDVVAD